MKLSICITVKNRSRMTLENGKVLYLFPDCIDSVVNSIKTRDDIEIIICDWHSTDLPLDEWIHDKLRGINYKIISTPGEFHRGTGRNVAANNAIGEILFFLDADMLLTKEVLLKAIENGMDKIYIPHCFYFINEDHSKGFWCSGKGNLVMPNNIFKKTEGWPCPPKYNLHYDEDQQFYSNLEASKFPIVRIKEKDFYHPYHPGKSVTSIFKPSQKQYIVSSTEANIFI